jgi:antitoxin (DNA-binding transcriptional repressor) of toxin-antitoxin stability system
VPGTGHAANTPGRCLAPDRAASACSDVWVVGYGRDVLRVTASEAVRHFRAVLGRVASGEQVEIVRDGATVAVIAPPPGAQVSPRLRGAGASFAEDLAALETELEAPPEAWAA